MVEHWLQSLQNHVVACSNSRIHGWLCRENLYRGRLTKGESVSRKPRPNSVLKIFVSNSISIRQKIEFLSEIWGGYWGLISNGDGDGESPIFLLGIGEGTETENNYGDGDGIATVMVMVTRTIQICYHITTYIKGSIEGSCHFKLIFILKKGQWVTQPCKFFKFP